MNIWRKLVKESEENNNTTAKLSKYLISFHNDYSKLSVKKVCRLSGVSYSTPTRLAQKLGYSGFNELKYSLIEYHQKKQNESFDFNNVKIGDYKNKINEVIDVCLNNINEAEIEDMAKVLISNEIIKIFGIGQSYQIGLELQSKLVRLNKIPLCPIDETDIYTSSRLAQNEDIIIAISYSGRSETVMEPLWHCYNKGIRCYLFTNNIEYEGLFTKTFVLGVYEENLLKSTMIPRLTLSIVFDLIILKILEIEPKYKEYLKITEKEKY